MLVEQRGTGTRISATCRDQNVMMRMDADVASGRRGRTPRPQWTAGWNASTSATEPSKATRAPASAARPSAARAVTDDSMLSMVLHLREQEMTRPPRPRRRERPVRRSRSSRGGFLAYLGHACSGLHVTSGSLCRPVPARELIEFIVDRRPGAPSTRRVTASILCCAESGDAESNLPTPHSDSSGGSVGRAASTEEGRRRVGWWPPLKGRHWWHAEQAPDTRTGGNRPRAGRRHRPARHAERVRGPGGASPS